jgi:hypothetical protein
VANAQFIAGSAAADKTVALLIDAPAFSRAAAALAEHVAP